MADRSWAARHVLEHCGDILDAWDARTRRVLPEVDGTPRLILRNYLIDYLHQLAAAFERLGRDQPDPARVSLEHAAVHGRLRATTPAYDLRQVVTEYRLLREVVREHLEQERTLSSSEYEVLVQVTEAQIEAAAAAYAETLGRVRAAVARGLGDSLLPALGRLLAALRGLREQGEQRPDVDRCLALAQTLLDGTDALSRSIHVEAGEVLEMRFHGSPLNELLQNIVREACLTYGDHFAFESPATPVRARFSRAGVERAVENVLDNARRHNGLDGRIEVTLREEGDDVLIGIHRLGLRLEPQARQRMLAGLAQAEGDEPGQAWGVGLRLVRDVAQAHGGKLETRDEGDDGAAVVLRLPKAGPGGSDQVLIAHGRPVPEEFLPAQKRQRSL